MNTSHISNYQNHIKVTLQLADGTPCEVVKYTVAERLSALYRSEIDFSVPDMLVAEDGSISTTGKQNWQINSLLDTQATLTIWVKNQPVRHFTGIISQCAEGKRGKRRQSYSIVIEPPLKRLALTSDWRIHQQQDVKDITEALLRRNGIHHHEYQLNHSYEKREFCVQAGETDLQYVQRMFAESGLYYYHEHDENNAKLIIKDKSEQSDHLLDIEYNPDAGGSRPNSALWAFGYQEQLVTAKHTIRDYTFKHPVYNLEQKSQGLYLDNQAKKYESYAYPGRYKKDASGKPFTKVRQESAQRHHRIATMTGDEPAIYPGIRIGVTGHHNQEHNQQWLVTEIIHEGRQPQSALEDAVLDRLDNPNSISGDTTSLSDNENSHYENHITAIPWYQPWRAPMEPKPTVDGPHIAMVVGPSGEEIYCDEHGRVKLHFYYDRYSQKNENSSCWVRVSQNWAGGQWGHMAIPRIGQEVIVEYLDGDPDQPIITGRTYHATQRLPYPLPANKTRMTIKSQTHKGDGFNELRFEDENSQEEIFMHAQKDQNNVVNNDETTQVGHDRTENVGNDETISIGHDRTESVGNDETISIGNDQSNTIGNDQSNSYGRNQVSKIGKDQIQNIGNHKKDEIYANYWLKTGGHFEHEVGGKAKLEAGESITSRTVKHEISGSEKVIFKSPGGTIIIDSGQITFKGNVTVKGSLSVTGGSPEGVTPPTGAANAGKMMEKMCGLRSDGTCPLSDCPCGNN